MLHGGVYQFQLLLRGTGQLLDGFQRLLGLGTSPAPAQAPAAPALISGRSEILPWLPSFPERFLLQSMRVFRLLCRQIELDFAAAREIVLPRGFGGAGRLAIQGLFTTKLSTPDRRLRAVNLLGAGGAVFCPAGAGEDALAADFAAAEFFRAENGLLQLRLLRQHGAAKPAAE